MNSPIVGKIFRQSSEIRELWIFAEALGGDKLIEEGANTPA